MKTRIITPVIIALLTASIGVAFGYAILPQMTTKENLVVAIQPTATPEAIRESSTELERFLEKRLSVDVDVYVPTSYAAAVEAIRFGHADVGFMSAWPAFLSWKMAGGEIGMAEVREVIIGTEKQQETYYYSYWVIPSKSPYTRLEDLRGKKACFPSPLSTSGYVAPLARLVELGYISRPERGKEADPKQFFSEASFAGGYAQCWEALRSGHIDTTVIAGDVSEKLYREVLANTRIIEQQGPIPSHGVVFSSKLTEPLKSKVKAALTELGREDYRPLMRNFISSTFVGFQETDNEKHLAPLRGYLDTTGLKYSERLG